MSTRQRLNSPVEQILTRLRAKVAELANQQEEVAESREQVLVDRGNLVRSGNCVREQRDRTANAEVLFMNVLRKYYNSIGATFPAEIDIAYSKVDEERTKLGSLEAEHTEIDQTLGAQEWSFMDKENDLYQYDLQLLSDEIVEVEAADVPLDSQQVFPEDPIPSSTKVQYQVETTEYSRLKTYFRTLRNTIARLFDTTTLDIDEADLVDIDSSEAVLSFDRVLTQLAECEVRLQHLKRERMHMADLQPSKVRRASEPLPYTDSHSTISNSSWKAYSEGAVSHLVEQVPVMHRVKEWLLDCLKQNVLDKMQYASMLKHNPDYIDNIELDFSDWEVLPTQQWPFETMVPKPSTQAAAVIESSSDRQTDLDGGLNYFQVLNEQMSEGQDMAKRTQRLKLEHDEQPSEGLAVVTPGRLSSELPMISIAHETMQDASPHTLTPEIHLAQAHKLSSPRAGSHFDGASVCSSSTSGMYSVINQVVGLVAPLRCDSAQGSTTAEPFGPASPRMPAIVELEDHSRLAVSIFDPEEDGVRNVQSHQDVYSTAKSGLVYSSWKWSSELQRYFKLVFTEDDNVTEAVWSEHISQCPIQDRETHSALISLEHSDSGPFPLVDLPGDLTARTLETPRKRSWADFCNKHTGHFNSRYDYVASSEQTHFYVTGRVFSTLWLPAIERYPQDLMRPRSQSLPTKCAGSRWYQLCFVVICNRESYSQCLSIQPSTSSSGLTFGSMSDWGIIYTSKNPPQPPKWEQLKKKPLRVHPKHGASLPADSRVYYGRVFPIEHKFPVLEIGVVVGDDIEHLHLQYTVVDDLACAGRSSSSSSLSSIPNG